jgi:hypothetical protein
MAAITGKSACKGPVANDISGTISRQASPTGYPAQFSFRCSTAHVLSDDAEFVPHLPVSIG